MIQAKLQVHVLPGLALPCGVGEQALAAAVGPLAQPDALTHPGNEVVEAVAHALHDAGVEPGLLLHVGEQAGDAGVGEPLRDAPPVDLRLDCVGQRGGCRLRCGGAGVPFGVLQPRHRVCCLSVEVEPEVQVGAGGHAFGADAGDPGAGSTQVPSGMIHMSRTCPYWVMMPSASIWTYWP